MKILSFIISFLISINSYAICDKNVYHLVKDQKAPCEGYLFSPEKEQEVRIKIKTYDYLLKYNDKQKEIIDVMNERIVNLQKYNSEIDKELQNRQKFKFWEVTLYFSLGALLTGAIAANVK